MHIRMSPKLSGPRGNGLHSAVVPARCSIPCDLCASTDVDEISLVDRDGSYLRTVICRRCGLVYSDPRPGREAVREYYEHYYRLDYKSSLQPKLNCVYRAGKVAVNRIRKFAPLLQPDCSILDVGAGGGEVVYVLRKMGYDASGFEPNSGYAKFASDVLGMPVAHGFYQEVSIEPESRDVITMFHVLEHLESPCDALRRVRQWLRKEGHLLVEVPNVEAVCQWPRSRFHRAHLYNFNPATLEMAGRRAGYQVVASSVSSDGGNMTVTFRNGGEATPVSAAVAGNCDRILKVLRDHTTLRDAFSRRPYIRVLRKIVARMGERRATMKMGSATVLLDSLVSLALREEPGLPRSTSG